MVNKSSVKVWNKFMQCLRHKIVRTIRYFKVASQWTWKYDDNADKFYIKRDNDEHD